MLGHLNIELDMPEDRAEFTPATHRVGSHNFNRNAASDTSPLDETTTFSNFDHDHAGEDTASGAFDSPEAIDRLLDVSTTPDEEEEEESSPDPESLDDISDNHIYIEYDPDNDNIYRGPTRDYSHLFPRADFANDDEYHRFLNQGPLIGPAMSDSIFMCHKEENKENLDSLLPSKLRSGRRVIMGEMQGEALYGRNVQTSCRASHRQTYR